MYELTDRINETKERLLRGELSRPEAIGLMNEHRRGIRNILKEVEAGYDPASEPTPVQNEIDLFKQREYPLHFAIKALHPYDIQ